MAESPNVSLTVASKPENVLLVRQVLSGVADAIRLSALDLTDISTTVTEACNNVVAHAYGDAVGPLELDIFVREATITVVVRDHGVGLRPRVHLAGVDPDLAGGIGVPVMLALASGVEFRDLASSGTEVRLEFATEAPGLARWTLGGGGGGGGGGRDGEGDGGGADDRSGDDALDSAVRDAPALDPDGVLTISLAPSELARAVLARVLAAAAARANFSTEGVSEARALGELLAVRSESRLGATPLTVEVGVAPRELGLRAGPFRGGRASELLAGRAGDGPGATLELNPEGITQERAGDLLTMRLRARP